MGSIYEYSLQYITGVGRRVPEFILVHEILPYCVLTNTHFGYAESGKTGDGVVEYATKAAFQARVEQLHDTQPFCHDTGTLQEPNLVPYTSEEVTALINSTWAKTQTLKAVVEGDVAYEYYYNDYDVAHFAPNVGLGDDPREVVLVSPSPVPDNLDVYWKAAPQKVGGNWVQRWEGRAFTSYELELYKAQKKQIINKERSATIDSGFLSPSLNKVVDSDLNSRVNIDQELLKAIISIVKNDLPYYVSWRFADNTEANITRDDVITLGEERRDFITSTYQASWARKAAVDSATTRKAVDEA